MRSETILCIPNEQVVTYFLGDETSPKFAPLRWHLAVPEACWFIPRAEAEVNPSYRQIIVYAVVVDTKDRVFTYRRKAAGEQRLEGRLSIGVGGHVNISDLAIRSGDVDFLGTVTNALRRELREELNLELFDATSVESWESWGVLRHSESLVDRAHLGNVFFVRLAEDASVSVAQNEGLAEAGFRTVEELIKKPSPEFEAWSRALVNHLDDLI